MSDLETQEAAFVAAILANPRDDTARKVYADWLDDYCPERRVQAKYLREIRRHKFVRLVKISGGWALMPQWAEYRGPKVEDVYAGKDIYGNDKPLSPRCLYWRRRMHRGWRVPRHMKGNGYYTRAQTYGVYTRELFEILDPITEYWGADE